MSLHVLGPLRTQVKLPGQSDPLSGVNLVYTITVEVLEPQFTDGQRQLTTSSPFRGGCAHLWSHVRPAQGHLLWVCTLYLHPTHTSSQCNATYQSSGE